MRIRTLIVDDEELARERLRTMLNEHGFVDIIGEADNGIDAVAEINRLAPDLVFLDIEMPGFNGFKVVQAIERDRLPHIIFVTAYNQYALDAFEVGAIDYLLKPIKKSRFLEALKRAQATRAPRQHQFSVAHNVQQRLMPEKEFRRVGVAAVGACLSLDEVGGDYFDFIDLGHSRYGFCIADISGKGFAAALMMSHLQAAMRILAMETPEPAALVEKINEIFYANSVPEMFATLFYGVYDRAQGTFTCCNAGHNPPLLWQGGALKRLECGGIVIGMFQTARYEQERHGFAPGDLILAYSDGLVELVNSVGEELGEAGLGALLEEQAHLSTGELKNLILAKATTFTAGHKPHDDLTVAIMKALA